ncbi:MAG: insulinase family protein [Bacteroidetes bacterium]|nr:insulinase family protein [Bacteroidota bacterium]
MQGTAARLAAVKTDLPYETVPNDPMNVRIYTLPNGLKVYLSVYKNAPRVQTMIAVKAGSKNDPADATGLAHYLEHMLFKGTDIYGTKNTAAETAEIAKIENLYEVYRKTKDEASRKKIYHQIDSISGVAAKYAIANEYDKMVGSIGAKGTNAFTAEDKTVYINDIPSNQISNWLKIEAERFRKPVLRLFHTELEAVYEEKNRSLDNDDWKAWEALYAGLFQKHTYGTQTGIGTIEHLKNPSLVEINKYYNKHYVPNNMAIIMSGDFNPDEVILQIQQNFGSFQSKPVETYTFVPEAAITKKIVKEVKGPKAASINMGWRFAGDNSRDADFCALLSGILYNGTAGLIDLNLNQAQKVLGGYAIYDGFGRMKDYSAFVLGGNPKEGQKLEDVEKLLLGQIELVKKGEFPDWLMSAVITDLKLQETKELEQNWQRGFKMMNAFVNGKDWKYTIEDIERMSKITKQELIDFTKKNFTANNYVVVYKRVGEDKNIQKVEKPAITPVDVDRENSSQFVKDISNAKPKEIEPKFLDYNTDITQTNIRSSIPLLYNKNTENNLFQLYYKFDMGSNNRKIYPIAIKYIPYLATPDMKAAQVKEELYKLGCSFDVYCDVENIWISLTGLSDNFDKAVSLFEKVLANPVVEESVLKNLISDYRKEREDEKLEKRNILNHGMVNYARYGALNPYTYVYSDEELNNISVNDIKGIIQSLSKFQHKVLYYGSKTIDEVKTTLNAYHNVPEKLNEIPPPQSFPEKTLDKTVYVVDYDMTQVEIIMLSNGESYKPELTTQISLYNNYFGGGMSGIVFQDLRESKALAYSTYSGYRQPNKLTKNYFNMSYIGSQADKLAEALKGMSDLLNNMPKAESTFNVAKDGVLQGIRTERITKSDILFNYLNAQNLGNNTDIRRTVFEKGQTLTLNDIEAFQEKYIKGKPTTILVLGKKDKLDLKVLEQYGTVKFLTLKDVFGY